MGQLEQTWPVALGYASGIIDLFSSRSIAYRAATQSSPPRRGAYGNEFHRGT